MNNNFSETSDYMTEPVKQITNNINDNQMLTYGLSFLFILYAFVASPTIPDNIANLFNNPLFKLSILIIIAYVAMQDPVTAVVITMIVLVVGQRLSASKKVIITDKSKTDIKTDAIAAVAAHTQAAKAAENKGAVEEAAAHRKEANKQEAKVEAIVKAEAHVAAAEEANKRGAVEEVRAHLQEAAKQEAKVEAIVKAEAHIVAAEKANDRGAVEEVRAHLQEAAKQEAKVEAIVKAEAHIAAAEEANTRGAVEEVRAHLQEAAKQEAKVESIVKAESGGVSAVAQTGSVSTVAQTGSVSSLLDDTVVPCGYEEDTLAPYTQPSTEPIKITLPENINNESDILGYDYLDYAVY